MKKFSNLEVWFATGSQDLYGEKTLQQVDRDSMEIAQGLNNCEVIPVKVVFKPVLITAESITKLCTEVNSTPNCVGLITWMHTFSPAKMWIAGLRILNKPLLHLHTQFNRDIPYADIDMDFMNLNQSAHGGREYGFIVSRLRMNRKVLVGHWKDEAIRERVGIWARVAVAWHDWQNGRVARFGDNMREVAVTEGDKVEAQIRFGFSVSGFGVGDLVKSIKEVQESDVERLVDEYMTLFDVDKAGLPGGDLHTNVRVQARYELGIKAFLEAGKFTAFTTTFEDLHGLEQLPGLAVQRLMAQGYGFGAEGDWKHAALVRALKMMGAGLPGGTSFMEDYTYHLDPAGMKVLGAHMLEICPTIAAGKPKLEVHPLGIGGKAHPARLVFNVPDGPAVNASMIDMGNRFRLIVNAVDVVTPDADFPKLPVARAMWKPRPNLQIGAAAWILAGGAHHTAFSQAVNMEFLEDFAEMADIELLLIDENTTIPEFKKELRWNEVYYLLNKSLR
jgi:L-arabinose isomerase